MEPDTTFREDETPRNEVDILDDEEIILEDVIVHELPGEARVPAAAPEIAAEVNPIAEPELIVLDDDDDDNNESTEEMNENPNVVNKEECREEEKKEKGIMDINVDKDLMKKEEKKEKGIMDVNVNKGLMNKAEKKEKAIVDDEIAEPELIVLDDDDDDDNNEVNKEECREEEKKEKGIMDVNVDKDLMKKEEKKEKGIMDVNVDKDLMNKAEEKEKAIVYDEIDENAIKNDPKFNPILKLKDCRAEAIEMGATTFPEMLQVHKFVWGKWRKEYYPAITYEKKHVGSDKISIIWFPQHTVSDLKKNQVYEFIRDFSERYKPNKAAIREGVLEALELMAKMAEKKCKNDAELIKWALMGFEGFKNNDTVLNDFLSPILLKIQEKEAKETKRKKDHQNSQKKRQKKEEESDSEPDSELNRNRAEILESKDIKEICLYCNRFDRELIPHPFFEGGLCKYQCSKKYKANIFVIGNDQKQVCCTICGRAGDLTVCDTENCTKSFCKWCLNSFLKEEHVQKINESPQWHCFLCTNEILENCHLKIQTQWNIGFLQFLDNNKYGIRYTDFANKRPINVLSLFDGIGTGLQALKELGLKVDNYFASEIDENAITVTRMNHKVSITHMGDINCITRTMLENLPKIDLVLGGSPCNDFSLANPARKNLEEESESRLFFCKFIEILTIVKELNNNVFYLFENVCPMENQTFRHIKEAFNNEKPAIIDAKYFSPMKRSRYFWSNIPGLHGIPEFWSRPTERTKFVLQDYLETDLNRTAMVETIKTVTSQTNSLIQKGNVLPVVMGNKPSQLWAKELERLFGFPEHYTEANLNPNQRLALLGKSWSLQVIKSILCPLKNFFECN